MDSAVGSQQMPAPGIGIASETAVDSRRTEPDSAIQREPARTPILSGVVQSTDGSPIEHAEISWIALLREDLEWESIWQAEEWGHLDRPSTSAVSESSGRFEFISRPDADLSRGSVLLACCQGFAAGGLELGADPTTWGRPVVLLEPQEPFHVRVKTPSGGAAEGAFVEQFGIVGRAEQRSEREFGSLGKHARLLFRKAITGSDGVATLVALPGEQVLVASRGIERSVPWRGSAPEDVELRLSVSFTVGGRVFLPTWEHLSYEGERRITLAARTGNLWRDLGTIRGVKEGPWGPVRLPLLPVDQYRMRLEGSPIIPSEELFEPPQAGANLVIDLSAEFGINLNFRVLDERDEVIHDARARVTWQDPKDSSKRNFVERGPAVDGNINLWTIPPGTITYEASAPGYVTYRSPVQATSNLEGLITLISLSRASKLRGQCLHGGEPVRDFEVVVWQPAAYDNRQMHSFLDREDGFFEIDSAPLGNTFVTASSPLYQACAPQQVLISADSVADVVLELADPLVGTGIVIDAETGDGLPEAILHLMVTGDRGPVQRWGLPRPVEADGSFEIAGFVEGTNYLFVDAPGFSTKTVSAVAASNDVLDWGEIALSKKQALRLSLTDHGSADSTRPFSAYSASGRGPQILPARAFSDDGHVTFDSVSAGSYAVEIQAKGEPRTELTLNLEPGEDWEFAIRIAGSNRLLVEPKAEEEELKRIHWIDAEYLSPGSIFTLRGGTFNPSKPFTLEGIEAASVQVTIYNLDLEVVATASGTFSGGSLDLIIPIGDEFFQVRVVDKHGDPIAGVRVMINDPQNLASFFSGSTDGEGECTILGVPRHAVVLYLQHSRFGGHYGIRCDASSGSAEVVLDAACSIHVELLDGEQRIPGVECAIVDLGERRIAVPATTDELGHAEFEALAAGPCSLSFRKAGCWPVQAEIEAKEEPSVTPVQIRQLADLEVEVRASGGLPVPGLAIGLQSVEFDAEVETWIAEGRCESDGLSSDEKGRIGVRGLPHGPYRWSLELPDGGQLDGEIELAPGIVNELPVILPE